MLRTELVSGSLPLVPEIRHSTVIAYRDATALLLMTSELGIINPTRRSTGNGRPTFLAKVLQEHKCWESIPKRREPVTKSMLLWIIMTAKDKSLAHIK